MKYFVIFAVLATLIGVALSDKPADIRNSCMAEAKIADADLKKFEADKDGTLPPTDNFKCFVKCVMTTMGSLKGDLIDVDAATKNLQSMPSLKGREADIAKAIAACKDTKGANPCDMAYNLKQCMKKQGLDLQL